MALFKKKKETPKYYSLEAINKHEAQYNIVYGERSNGKTYACLEQGLKNYYEKGEKFVYLRRWDIDLKQGRANKLFDGHAANGLIERYSGGAYTDMMFWCGGFYPYKIDSNGKTVRAPEAIGYGMAISNMQHDKSISYPTVTNIYFDEFITREGYLVDEFISFMNIVSTIVRLRTNVTIYMMGNTVSKDCLYFNEMGLKHIDKIKKGEIEIYTYGKSDLRVAVEFSDTPMENKPSSIYFGFDNPRLEMITSGVWEMDRYPHCPSHIDRTNVLLSYVIDYDDADTLLQGDVICDNDKIFTYIHEKTSPIKKDTIVYTPEHNPNIFYLRKINKPINKATSIIWSHFQTDKVFYQDNETGERVRNYIQWCK